MIEKPIRVLHVVKVMNHGGAETMIMNLYRKIDKTKVQFDFLNMMKEDGEYEEEIKQLGGKIYKVPSPDIGRIKNLKSVYKVLKENKEIKVIHSHISYYSGFVNFTAFLAGIKIRIVHSHTISDVRKQNIIRRCYNQFSKILIKLFSNYKIACGEKAGKYLYGKSNYQILKNGIDLEKFTNVKENEIEKLRTEFKIPKEDFIIGHVGRFEKVKNQIFLLKLAEELKKDKSNFKIILVGDGSEFNHIKEKIETRKLENYFILTGIRDDIPIFMNLFDVFILPSLYEGFPLVVVEALAGQNKCYLSDTIPEETKVIPEMIRFFSINGDIKSLKEQILKTETKKSKSEIKKSLIEKGYSIKDSTKQLMKIYLK